MNYYIMIRKMFLLLLLIDLTTFPCHRKVHILTIKEFIKNGNKNYESSVIIFPKNSIFYIDENIIIPKNISIKLHL